jgi:hypothetical protein
MGLHVSFASYQVQARQAQVLVASHVKASMFGIQLIQSLAAIQTNSRLCNWLWLALASLLPHPHGMERLDSS